MMTYVCIFRCWHSTSTAQILECGFPSLINCKEGFWLNEDYEPTQQDDAWMWIPPSQILSVRKDSG